jgi:hypothetical protein
MGKNWIILFKENDEITNRRAVEKLYAQLKNGKHILEVSSYNKRSNPQNRYYWGLVIPLIQKGIEDLGTELTKEETHELLKARFNFSEIVNEETGECIQIPRSTTTLNKEQFGEYISKIQQFAAEFLNIEIPDPSTQMAFNYE